MSPELATRLHARHLLIFTRLPRVSCGDGWFDLLDALCESLQGETENGGPQVVAFQVKEKFGGLRFYTGACNDAQRGMIVQAQAFSWRICEVCGSRGETYGPTWFRTRCEAHADPEKESSAPG